jgi:hypothetical protein
LAQRIIETVIGRLITDEEFRSGFMANPERTLLALRDTASTDRFCRSSDVVIQVGYASAYSPALLFNGFHIAMALAGHAERNSIDSFTLAGTRSLATTVKPSFAKYESADVVSK